MTIFGKCISTKFINTFLGRAREPDGIVILGSVDDQRT